MLRKPSSKFAVTYHRTNFRVGADRRVRPRVAMPIGQLRLRGGCLALVPRSPDVTRNSDAQLVRLGLAVPFSG